MIMYIQVHEVLGPLIFITYLLPSQNLFGLFIYFFPLLLSSLLCLPCLSFVPPAKVGLSSKKLHTFTILTDFLLPLLVNVITTLTIVFVCFPFHSIFM